MREAVLSCLPFKNLVGKDLKWKPVGRGVPERSICVFLGIRMKRMKLQLWSFNTSQQVGRWFFGGVGCSLSGKFEVITIACTMDETGSLITLLFQHYYFSGLGIAVGRGGD